MSFCYTVYSSYPLLKHNIFNNNSSEIGIGSIVLCLLYFCSATCTIFSIRKQQRKALSNQHYEGMALHVVFPVYLPIMWISAITDLFVVIAIVFIKFHNDSDESKNLLVASICAMAFGFQHMVLEGLAFLLMQYGCGLRAIQISTMVGILAGIYTFLSILFYYNYHVALLYFGWSISLLILYLVLYLTPMKWLFRRPAIIFYAKFWSLFYVLQSLALGLLILGDYLSTTSSSNSESGEYTNMTGMCLYHLGVIPLFVICKPFIMYQTLLIESTWWQGLSLYKINYGNNSSSIHSHTSYSLLSNSYSITTNTNKEERDVESIEQHQHKQQQECDDTEEIEPLILAGDKTRVVRSPIPDHPSYVSDSWFTSIINYLTNNNNSMFITKNHHPHHHSHHRKKKQYHGLNNQQQQYYYSGSACVLDRQVSVSDTTGSSSNNFEELKGPLLGVEVGFSEAQQLAQEVDKINSLGMVKLLNFAYLSLNKKGSNLIGAGSFSKVYSGKYRNNPVAIKMLFTQDLNPEVIKRCSNEARILAELAPNSHVVKIFGVAVLPPSVCIVLEICEFGSLADVLRGRNAGYGGLFGNTTPPTTLPLNLTYTDKMYLALGCARGLQALHSYSSTLCHRDIKSFNFLIDSQLNAKIADLDLGHEYNNNNIQKTTTNNNDTTITTNSVTKQLKGNEQSMNTDYSSNTSGLLVSEYDNNDNDTMASPISKVGGSNMW